MSDKINKDGVSLAWWLTQGKPYIRETDENGNLIGPDVFIYSPYLHGELPEKYQAKDKLRTVNIDEQIIFDRPEHPKGIITEEYYPHSKNEFIDSSRVIAEWSHKPTPEELNIIEELFKDLQEEDQTIDERQDEIIDDVKVISNKLNIKNEEWEKNGVTREEATDFYSDLLRDLSKTVLKQLKINVIKEFKKGGE